MKSSLSSQGYLKGRLTVLVSGRGPERFFNLCSFHGIAFNGIEKKEKGLVFRMDAEDFFRAGKLARKAQVKLKIVEKKGIPFFLRRSRKRLAFYLGILICTGFLYRSSLYIWDIQVEGNTKYTDRTLLKYLDSLGYVHGMKKEGIVCEEIEKEIRNRYNDITWVSAQITGTRLIVRMKENQILEASVFDNEKTSGDLTAGMDGTIVRMVTREGTPLVHVGDEVESGALLISGLLEIKDEGGNLIRTEEVRADGDVTARVSYFYEDSFPMLHSEKCYTGEEMDRFYFWLLGKRFFFPGKKRQFASYDTLDSYTQIHLWNNFYLPVGWGKLRMREYKTAQEYYSQEAAKQEGEQRFSRYCEKLEEEGLEIEQTEIQIFTDPDTCKVTGSVEGLKDIAVGKKG